MIHCAFENKDSASLRHVTVCGIVYNQQNQILLETRASYLTGGDKYAIPGGFLDRGETTQACVLRELKEETGLEGKVMYLLRINDNPNRRKEDRQNVEFIYVVQSLGGEFKKDTEVAALAWFDHTSLPAEDEFAFDHRDSLEMYFKHLQKPMALPILR